MMNVSTCFANIRKARSHVVSSRTTLLQRKATETGKKGNQSKVVRINFYIVTPPTYWSDADETASLVSWNTLDCLRPHAGENRREREPAMDSDGGGNGRRGRAGNPRRESSNLVPSRLEVCKNKRDVRATCPMRRRSPRYLAISAGAVLAATASRSWCGLEERVEPRHENLNSRRCN